MNEETSKQWSGAVLAGLGILGLVVLAAVRRDMPIEAAGYGIVALAMRGAGLVTHALRPNGGK